MKAGVSVKSQLSLKRILVDGTVLSVLLTLVIYGSIYVNPLLWIGDYPPDIQAAVGPVDVPLVQIIVFTALAFGAVIGVTLYSNARLRRENSGELSFLAAFANSALILLFFATWDLLILDWLIFVTIQPDFVVIPGTEGLTGYKDYWFHFEVSFLGLTQWISIVVGGLVAAGLSMIRLRKSDADKRNEKEEMTVWGVGPRFTAFSVAYLILALVAHYVWYPRFVIQGVPYAVLVAVGLLLMAIGIPIWVTASHAVDRAFEEGHLATQGIYALCRHPVYGNAIFFTIPGFLLFFRSWLLLTVPVAMYAIFKLFIQEEEEYLKQKFGSAYLDYEREVNALFPRVWKLVDAFFYPLPTGRIAENVYALRDGDVNFFIYTDGADAVAIDAGYPGSALRDEKEALRRLPIPLESVTHVFLTHADHDHTGKLDWFENAHVYLGEGEEQMIDGTTSRMVGVYHSPKIDRPYTLVADGDVVTVGAIKVHVVATPGHTPGSTSFLVDDRVLFTGDTLVLQDGLVRPFYRLFNMDTAVQRDSIRKLARLEDVALLCTAHTGCTEDYTRAMAHHHLLEAPF